jgi:hypothetical protein
MVPKNLTDDPLQRGEVCSDLLQWIGVSDEWLNGVITAEESWVIQHGLVPKRHSIQCKSRSSPRPKEERMSISKAKTMQFCIFDGYGIVHHKIAPHSQTFNQKCCLEFWNVWDSGFVEGPESSATRGSCTMPNVPSHTALSDNEFLPQKPITVQGHPAYPPDLAPCNLFLYPAMRSRLKRHILKQWKRLKTLWRLHETWKTTTSGSASTDRNNAEIHVLLWNVTSLKGPVFHRGESGSIQGKAMWNL